MTETILVVDDDAGIRELLRLKLENSGFDVDLRSSGEKCLAYLDEEPPPDLVLLDVKMPKVSGFEVLERMRTDLDAEPPVVLLTRAELPEDDDMAGATDYLRKPFRVQEVIERVERIVAD